MLKLLYEVNGRTLMQYHQLHFTMILMIYINDSTIFILIYPCCISILLYRLYSTILCIQLSCCFIYPGIFIPAYILLCTFMMIHRHEHIYSIHLPILSMLSSLHAFIAFIAFIAFMLLYFYMIRIAFVSWPGFSAFLCHTRIYYIVFIYMLSCPMMALYF